MDRISSVRTRAARRYSTAGTNWPWRKVSGPAIEALGDVVPRELVEDGGRLRPEHQGDGVERVILGQLDGNQIESKRPKNLQLLALVGGSLGFLDVADLEPAERDLGRPVEGLIDGRRVKPVVAVDGVEDEGAVLDRAGNRPDLVHRPRQRHAAMAAYPAEGWPQARAAAGPAG
jgi:hypothetical protein